MMTLNEAVKKIRPLDEKAIEGAKKRWDSIAKPLHSLGELENMLIQIAGITGTPDVRVEKKAVVAMCADNGVVEEGVTQTGQEVTAIVAENFLNGATTCCVMCRQCGAELFPVDVGMVVDTKVRTDLKVAYGTKNMTKEPAMTREQAIKGIEAGIAMAQELKEKGLWFVCADMGGTEMYKLDLKGPIGLVIGNEGEGVSRLVREKCDFIASIPMKGDIDSLNASVAAGVLAYEIVRQRMM